jgi:hypothetical protein
MHFRFDWRFRFDVWPVAIAAWMLASGAAPLRAQSLADVARQEEARRKEIKQPAKVYTNKDLVSVPSTSSQTASSTAPAGRDAAGKDAEDGSKDAKDAAKDAKDATKDTGGVKDQAYWANRLKTLTAQLDRDQMLADALQSRVNAMTFDSSERQKAVEELDHLTKAVESDRKALDDFQEEARRASVPPGWLR